MSGQSLVGRREERPRLLGRTHEGSRILNTPMSPDRLAGPERTGLTGSRVTDRDHQVDLRCPRSRELVPALASKVKRIMTEALQRERMRRRFRMAPRAVATKPKRTPALKQRLSEQAPGRVPRTKKKYATILAGSLSQLLWSSGPPPRVAPDQPLAGSEAKRLRTGGTFVFPSFAT